MYLYILASVIISLLIAVLLRRIGTIMLRLLQAHSKLAELEDEEEL